jgi:hypothetical protein
MFSLIPYTVDLTPHAHIILPLSGKKVIYLRFFLIRRVVENLTPSDANLTIFGRIFESNQALILKFIALLKKIND